MTRTRKTARGRFHVGTSGFSHEPWRGAFNLVELKSRDMLRYHETQHSCVEITLIARHHPGPGIHTESRCHRSDACICANASGAPCRTS